MPAQLSSHTSLLPDSFLIFESGFFLVSDLAVSCFPNQPFRRFDSAVSSLPIQPV